MDITTVAVLLLAVVVGISLGLLGGGGSILTVPLLTYVAGFPPKEAIAASLLVVGVTSVTSMLAHARRGNVQWRTGLLFGAAGMAGAFAGGLVGGHVPGTILMIAFAAMMIATAAAMIRGRRNGRAPEHDGTLKVGRTIVDGLVVGLVTGLVGAGGGFLVVPALVLLGGLPMSVAVGTSLLVIGMKSFAGLAGYLTSVSLDWGLVAAVTVAAVVGSLVGARLSSRVPEAALRRGFGYFVLVMGVFVLVQELPGVGGLVVAVVAGVVAVAAVACRLAGTRCPVRSRVAAH
ncbi:MULTISPECIES: sulfite exporter TauE/SafE family protein [unclassified Isoptericola]|uniref:sulfite exporter TauE/SafE family protein n=1 Tax=unclassified Isoptericola TaxID=2623355 RepID=UPI0027125A3A|nr:MULTISPECIES: sulfite exporter TauE/SafE family protein [unclassified Isoptericola]MDO8144001.1 sulfite exporter TauE/SafE family protein [Isoptericola sp. 178]MDO8149417.1 sulfite exporter TauE/SafE family protein [Isoptericola sp. b515]MDO8152364.1 sulfite exporter TauE/SafE family protein [Isoptericola sp. b408]